MPCRKTSPPQVCFPGFPQIWFGFQLKSKTQFEVEPKKQPIYFRPHLHTVRTSTSSHHTYEPKTKGGAVPPTQTQPHLLWVEREEKTQLLICCQIESDRHSFHIQPASPMIFRYIYHYPIGHQLNYTNLVVQPKLL